MFVTRSVTSRESIGIPSKVESAADEVGYQLGSSAVVAGRGSLGRTARARSMNLVRHLSGWVMQSITTVMARTRMSFSPGATSTP